jgi:hypothetical protein
MPGTGVCWNQPRSPCHRPSFFAAPGPEQVGLANVVRTSRERRFAGTVSRFRERVGVIGKRAGMDPGSLLLPLGFHLAEESGAQDGVGLPDVGQVHGQKLSPDFEAAILIYISRRTFCFVRRSGFRGRSTRPRSCRWVCLVCLLAEELGPGGSAATKHGDGHQTIKGKRK